VTSSEKHSLIYNVLLQLITIGLPLLILLLKQWSVGVVDRKANAMEFLRALTATVVLDLEKEVRDLKDPRLPGEWTPEVAKRVKQTAIRLIQQFGQTELNIVLHAADGSESKEDFLAKLVEAQVQLMRSRQNKTLALPETPPAPPVTPSPPDQD